MKILAVHIANLFEYAQHRGISKDVLRENLNPNNIDVCNPNNYISKTEFLTIFNKMIKLTDDCFFGIHYGCYLNIKALGFIVQMALNATSIEQIVSILQKYFDYTFSLIKLTAEVKGEKYIIRLNSEIEDSKLRNHILDVVYCFVFRELKLMVSADFLPFLEIPNNDILEYSKVLNFEVSTGKEYSLIFKKSVLSIKINQKSAREIELLLPKFLQMLEMNNSNPSFFSTQVREVILKLSCPELPNFEQVAVHFPLSQRSIQRRLTQEGVSFRQLTDGIKKELSYYLLNGNQLKTQEIAYLLGYSESSAYLHAAKKWKLELLS